MINYIAIVFGAVMLFGTGYQMVLTAGATGPNCPNLVDKTYLGFCTDADPDLWVSK